MGVAPEASQVEAAGTFLVPGHQNQLPGAILVSQLEK